MKNLYTLTFLALVASSVSAQTNLNVPRPLAPGVHFRLPFVQSQNVKVSSMSSLKSASAGANLFVRSADIAGYEPYDSLLLTKISRTHNDVLTEVEQVDYDQYALRKSHSKYIESDGLKLVSAERYNYVVGAYNFWNTKLVENSTDSIVWNANTKVEREYDENKRLVKEKTYNCAGDVYLMEEVCYGYELLPQVEIVKTITYDKNGNITAYTEKSWNPQLKEYYVSASQNKYYRTETTVGEDYYDVKQLMKSYTSDSYYLSKETYNYFGNSSGTLQIDYSEYSSDPLSMYGSKTVIYPNIPTLGDTAVIDYTYSSTNQDWIPSNKYVYSSTLYNVVPGKTYYEASYHFVAPGGDYLNGYYELVNESKGEWIQPNLLKVNSSDEPIYYYFENLNGNWLKCDVIFGDDGSFISHRNAVPDDYSADDNIESDNVGHISTYYDDKAVALKSILYNKNMYYEKVNGDWNLLTSYTEEEKIDSNFIVRHKSFTNEGAPLLATDSLIYANGAKAKLLSKTAYTYYNDGYKVEEYEANIKAQSREYLNLADGGYQMVELNYEANETTGEFGEIKSGLKTLLTNIGLYVEYSYDVASKNFVETSRRATSIETTDSLDYTTTITCSLDEDGNAQPKTKKIVRLKPNIGSTFSAEYAWDSDKQNWVGQSKMESSRVDNVPEIWWKAIELPSFDNYNDNFVETSVTEDLGSPSYSNSFSYVWDNDKDEWTQSSAIVNTFVVDENVITRFFKTTDNAGVRLQTIMRTYSDESIVEDYVSVDSSDVEGSYVHTQTTFTLNSKGLVSQKKVVTSNSADGEANDVDIFDYEFTPWLVYPNSIASVDNKLEGISVNGLIVSGAEGASVEIIGLNGILISKGQGSAKAPKAGTYIVRANGKAMLVILK